ncbi:hypothetical protein ASD15_29645 [Massilia sp. Root351]|jgi:predicted porin|uniref:porin n=1 Tax=Massilia sp. Root351 TaxID=1736522 RepID=UPI00070CF3D5|nr:porin [Massilia sp. Root351]KQV86239.1 hypothetical protein ASD15_29645 [Massilia sp. Root351]
MKKTLLSVAMCTACSLSGLAAAQSSVAVYGAVDAGIVRESGGVAGNITKLTGGVEGGSRLGFRGSEDLGDGMKGIFALEMGFGLDTGVSGQGGVLFGRQALVGLQTKSGTLTLGRQYTPLFMAMTNIDPFQSLSTAGSAANLMSNAGIRMNNTVKYAMPDTMGFSGELAYGLGEVAGNSDAGRNIGANAGYTSGPLSIKAAYANINSIPAGTAAMTKGRTTMLGATYDFGVAKAALAYSVNRGTVNINNTINPNGQADSRDLLLGVTVPYGPHTLRASIINKKDRAGTRRGADQWGVGYSYYLSRRTDVYLAYASIDNDAAKGATGFYTVGNATEVGSGDRAINLGMRHTF